MEIRFSPDDSQLISYSADDGNFILWDVKSGRQIWSRETGFIRKIKERINLKEFYWSADSKALVTKSENGTFQTWDSSTGKILAVTETKPEIALNIPDKRKIVYARDYQKLTAVDTSHNGELIAEGGNYGDGFVKTTNVKTGEMLWLGAHPGIVKEIKFSLDGKTFAGGGRNQNVFLFNAETGEKLWQLLSSYQPGDLEIQLEEQNKKRLAETSN